jgi:D-3-phosphoglycerate dehydrogenase
MRKVLLTNPIHPVAVRMLEEVAEVIVVSDTSLGDLKKAIVGVDALIVRTPISADILSHANKLKIIVRHGVGLDFVPVKEATERGILVANVPGANTEAVAEHVIGMFLLLARQFHRLNLGLRQAKWNSRDRISGVELQNKNLGVMGLGRIGHRVASIAHAAFGMTILGYDPYIKPFPEKVKKVSLEVLFQESDFITVHVPLMEETRHLVDLRLLSQMKPTAFFVNASRGPIIDERALVKVLAEKRIAGAALDVYDVEPLPEDHPFLSLDNVFLTPHSAALTTESIERMGIESAQEVVRALKGDKPLNLVNPKVWEIYAGRSGS